MKSRSTHPCFARLLKIVERLTRILFVVNTTKPGAEALASKLDTIARDAGVLTQRCTHYPITDGALRDVDACCVIGGDGTILGVVNEARKAGVPVLGVNQGKLGFMSTFSAEEALFRFKEVIDGAYRTVTRELLCCTLRTGENAFALNDIVIRTTSSRLIELGVRDRDEWINGYSCDGLVFSTPTGSTAYNLSAGGPIIHPAATVICMTPICPHTLSNRSVILNAGTEIHIDLISGNDVRISGDGQPLSSSEESFPLTIRLASESVSLVQSVDYSYYRLIREKLRWGHEN